MCVILHETLVVVPSHDRLHAYEAPWSIPRMQAFCQCSGCSADVIQMWFGRGARVSGRSSGSTAGRTVRIVSLHIQTMIGLTKTRNKSTKPSVCNQMGLVSVPLPTIRSKTWLVSYLKPAREPSRRFFLVFFVSPDGWSMGW